MDISNVGFESIWLRIGLRQSAGKIFYSTAADFRSIGFPADGTQWHSATPSDRCVARPAKPHPYSKE
jgi:hypothetical protein